MTIKEALIAYLGGDAAGGTIAEVLASASSGGTTTTYTVAFDLNGGSGTTPDSVTGEAGESVTLPDGTGITPPSEKVFKGWAETDSATEALEGYTISEDATLYAVYGDS